MTTAAPYASPMDPEPTPAEPVRVPLADLRVQGTALERSLERVLPGAGRATVAAFSSSI